MAESGLEYGIEGGDWVIKEEEPIGGRRQVTLVLTHGARLVERGEASLKHALWCGRGIGKQCDCGKGAIESFDGRIHALEKRLNVDEHSAQQERERLTSLRAELNEATKSTERLKALEAMAASLERRLEDQASNAELSRDKLSAIDSAQRSDSRRISSLVSSFEGENRRLLALERAANKAAKAIADGADTLAATAGAVKAFEARLDAISERCFGERQRAKDEAAARNPYIRTVGAFPEPGDGYHTFHGLRWPRFFNTCYWHQDPAEDIWQSSCGSRFLGQLRRTGTVKFCPTCGLTAAFINRNHEEEK